MTYFKTIIILIIFIYLTDKPELNCQISSNYAISNHGLSAGMVNNYGENILNNPAFIDTNSNSKAGLNVVPSRFGIEDLNAGNLFYSFKMSDQFYLHADIHGMGGELFSEYAFRLSSSFRIDENMTIGGAAEYAQLTIKDNSDFSAVMFHVGSIIHISDRISAGIAMHNITRADYGNIEENVDQTALIGLGIKTENEIYFEFGGVVGFNNMSGFVFGIRHKILDMINTKISAGTNPRSIEIGIGYGLPLGFDLNFSIYYDQTLGYGKNIGLLYSD